MKIRTLITTAILALSMNGFAGDLPDRLTALQEQRQKALDRANAPIEQTYRAELTKLLAVYEAAGDDEAALAVRLAMSPDFPSVAGKHWERPELGGKLSLNPGGVGTLITPKKVTAEVEWVQVRDSVVYRIVHPGFAGKLVVVRVLPTGDLLSPSWKETEAWLLAR